MNGDREVRVEEVNASPYGAPKTLPRDRTERRAFERAEKRRLKSAARRAEGASA